DPGALGNVPMITLTGSDATIAVDGTAFLNVLGLVTGGAGIIKDQPGILQLSGITGNNYTGTTAVTAGTLELDKTERLRPNSPILAVPGALVIGRPGVLSDTPTVQLLGRDEIAIAPVTIHPSGTLNLFPFHQAVGPLTMNGGTITGFGGTLALTQD